MTALTVNYSLRLRGDLANTAYDIGSANYSLDYSISKNYTNGNTTGLANAVFSDTRTIANETNDDLDLTAGLVNAYGTTIVLTKIKTIVIEAAATNTDVISIGAAGANPFVGWFADTTDIINIPAGASIALHHPGAGWNVAVDSADILRIANLGTTGTLSYSIVIVGTTA